MSFSAGGLYTRQQINASVGGGLQDYLPTHNGIVVAGCFRMDLNPAAPRVILPGRGRRIQRAAHVLARQVGPIPVFIKQAASQWRYEGDYTFDRQSTDPDEIKKWKKQAGRTDVTQVIFLRRDDR